MSVFNSCTYQMKNAWPRNLCHTQIVLKLGPTKSCRRGTTRLRFEQCKYGVRNGILSSSLIGCRMKTVVFNMRNKEKRFVSFKRLRKSFSTARVPYGLSVKIWWVCKWQRRISRHFVSFFSVVFTIKAIIVIPLYYGHGKVSKRGRRRDFTVQIVFVNRS